MKKFLIGAAASAALLAPGLAIAETDAVVGLQFSNTDAEGFDYDTYGINGAFDHDFSNGWTLQMDGAANRIDADGCCLSQSYATLHYGQRNDQFSYAGFIGLQDFYLYSGVATGVEGQWHLSNVTFEGAIAYVDFGDVDFDGVGGSLGATLFVTPDFSVGASATHFDIDDADGTNWGLEGEYRFAGSPASIVLAYASTDDEIGDTDTWTIGLNFDLGTGSLQERMQSGPSWNGGRALNDIFAGFLPII
jgi:hypothetical protein